MEMLRVGHLQVYSGKEQEPTVMGSTGRWSYRGRTHPKDLRSLHRVVNLKCH